MSAPPQPSPVVPGELHENRGPKLIAVLWTLTGLCIGLQLLRFYVRWTVRQMGADDYWMYFTTAVFVAYSIICTLLAAGGGEKHAKDLWTEFNLEHIEYVRKLGRVAPVFVVMDLAFSKISVALLILRYLRSQHYWQRWFLIITIFLTPVILGLSVIFNFVQCNPAHALWDYNVTADCWHPRVFINYAMFSSAWSAFMNIALALLPITLIQRASIAPARTAALFTIIAIGILAGAMGIYKTTQLPNLLNTVDFTWSTYISLIYSAVELSLIIIAGTMPTFCPLWELFLDKIPLHPLIAMSPLDREAALKAFKFPHHNSATFLRLAIPSNVSSEATTDDASTCAVFMAMLRAARTRSRPGSWTIRMDRTIDVIWSNGRGSLSGRPSIFGSFSRKASLALFRSRTSSRNQSTSTTGTSSTAVGSRHGSRASRSSKGSRQWSVGSHSSRNASLGTINGSGSFVQYQSIVAGNQNIPLVVRTNLEHISETQTNSTRSNSPNHTNNTSRASSAYQPPSPLSGDPSSTSRPPSPTTRTFKQPSANQVDKDGEDTSGTRTPPRVKFRMGSIWSNESLSLVDAPRSDSGPSSSSDMH